jgi:hypothetical protein
LLRVSAPAVLKYGEGEADEDEDERPRADARRRMEDGIVAAMGRAQPQAIESMARGSMVARGLAEKIPAGS